MSDKEYSVEDVLVELQESGLYTDQEITKAFGESGHDVQVMKFQKPVFPVTGDWLVYNEERNVLQAFRPDMMDPLFIDMNKRGSNLHFYWTWIHDNRIQALLVAPCNQVPGW